MTSGIFSIVKDYVDWNAFGKFQKHENNFSQKNTHASKRLTQE